MNDSGFTLIAFIGLFCLAVMAPSCGSVLAGGDFLIGYPTTVTGEVTQDPGRRYQRGESSGTEKVAITIAPDQTPPASMLSAFGNNVLTVECVSTRCAQVLRGQVHELACRTQGRFLEPNVVECKHVRRLGDRQTD